MSETPKCTMKRGCPCRACAAELAAGMVPQSERTERMRERIRQELARVDRERANAHITGDR